MVRHSVVRLVFIQEVRLLECEEGYFSRVHEFAISHFLKEERKNFHCGLSLSGGAGNLFFWEAGRRLTYRLLPGATEWTNKEWESSMESKAERLFTRSLLIWKSYKIYLCLLLYRFSDTMLFCVPSLNAGGRDL